MGLSVWETQVRDLKDKGRMQIGGGSRHSFLLFSLKMCAFLTEEGGKEETVIGREKKRKNSKKKKATDLHLWRHRDKSHKNIPFPHRMERIFLFYIREVRVVDRQMVLNAESSGYLRVGASP